MQRLLGYVIFDKKIENVTIENYDARKLNVKAICISSIDERTKQRLYYLAKDILKTLSYADFDKFKEENKSVIISMLYNPITNKTEVYSTGVVKNKLSNSNNTYLQRQLSIAVDYFRKDMVMVNDKSN
jgi:hypothetical protein